MATNKIANKRENIANKREMMKMMDSLTLNNNQESIRSLLPMSRLALLWLKVLEASWMILALTRVMLRWESSELYSAITLSEDDYILI